MGSFGIFAIVVTFIFVIYYVVMICLDLFGTKGEKKDSVEVIHAGTPVENTSGSSATTPINVNEEADGKFSINNPDSQQEETKKEQDITPPAEEEGSSVPSGQESLSATDIIGADIDEIAAQSKAKVDGINEKLNTIPPTIQGAVYVDEFQETFMEALEKARDTEEQAEQLLSV